MSHRKFEHPRHGSLGFLPRKRASRHRGKGTCCHADAFVSLSCVSPSLVTAIGVSLANVHRVVGLGEELISLVAPLVRWLCTST